MEQVILKSRIGQHEIRYRPLNEWGLPECHVFNWNFDNDFKVAVPLEWWQEQQEKILDPTANLRYKEAFFPLKRITT